MRKTAAPPHSSRGAGAAGENLKLGEVLDFMRLLWAVDHGLHSRSKHMKVHLGVTSPQRLVIRLAGRFPGISAGELAKLLHVHPSTLTGVLGRLVKQRLLTRVADPADARRALFHLTGEGEQLNHSLAGTVEGAVRKALGHLTRAHVKTASSVLAQVAAQLSHTRARG